MQSGLARCAPRSLRVARQLTVILDRDDRPEPDLSIARRSPLPLTGEETFFPVAETLLVAAAVSADTAARDRRRKPLLSARAGTPHFWLVERMDNGRPTVHSYELDRVGATYEPTGIHHDRLKLPAPFTIDIDLTEIDRM
ncbi:Uma2 family endonuclease [Streptomyces sp. V4-01]|uniref:Uma2 family endonuclease n=1 Tax=Actinacidiphila polyblastidii TaxID=3110430 RepID=A0ABU7P4T4_9ACTN|nr:Uma2 family endonuclease [Streptomyces sp. V4-01]